jgi:hypothetical protein
MANEQVDVIDIPPIILWVFGGFITLGFVPKDFDLLGWAPGGPLLTLPGDTVITAAMLIQIVAISVVYYTNEPDIDWSGSIQGWVVLMSVGLIVLQPFVPLIQWALGSTLAKLFAFIIQTFGISFVAYLG